MSRWFVVVLAAIAAVVLIGVAKGVSMWGWIVAYWAVLTAKNVYDAARRGKE